VRFLPDIRYGTENYPEKVARRLRALNLVTWCVAAVAASGVASDVVLEFLDPKPGLWKAATVYALAALIYASIPLLHRFGTLERVVFTHRCAGENSSRRARKGTGPRRA